MHHAQKSHKMTTYAIIFPKDAVQRPFSPLLTHPAQVFPTSDQTCSGSKQRPYVPWKQARQEHSARRRPQRSQKIKGRGIHTRILRAFEPHLPRRLLVAQRDIAHFEDSSLVRRPTSQFLSLALPATALRTSTDSSVDSLTRIFGNGMVSARKTRSSNGVCALPATASSNAVAREKAACSERSGSGRRANSLNSAASVE